MALRDDPGTAPASPARRRLEDAPVAIQVRGVSKRFLIPEHRVDSLRERLSHPRLRVEHRALDAVRDVSFEVHRGEFFGIVGRNGSGKSTLLKILASIYAADAGRVRMAGRVAPFIELGVGFNPELAARENIVLNGVLMGLGRREARRRYDAVLDFAELRDFADLKIKNYSSGMMVRLAFAIMVQADADVMLIDEVLAVGDAAFAQKCMDVFHERRQAGRTIILVTHDMATVQSMCHRAMLLEEGVLQFIGDPEMAAMRYLQENFSRPVTEPGGAARTAVPDFNLKVLRAQLRDAAGQPQDNLAQGDPIVLDIELEALRDLQDAIFIFQIRNEDRVVVSVFERSVEGLVEKGRRLRIRGTVENRLTHGRHFLDCWARRESGGGDFAVQGLRLLEFVVYGTGGRAGVVRLDADVDVVPEP
jgi:ABC-type polysaccharide/polyol phosphate transport system ATPase subunit